MSEPTRAIDPVTLTVIDNFLTSTCRDMGVTMMKTSYSPIFNESLDFSCVIFDPQGQMLAQAEFCPSQIGTIKFAVSWTNLVWRHSNRAMCCCTTIPIAARVTCPST